MHGVLDDLAAAIAMAALKSGLLFDDAALDLALLDADEFAFHGQDHAPIGLTNPHRLRLTRCERISQDMADREDKRGAPKGSIGNVPHVRCELAANVIEKLAGYGMPQLSICDFLEWAGAGLLDLGGQGYSQDTLQRHYRDALDKGKKPGLETLMHRMYAMAMMENVPPGVTPDRAYAISAEKLMALLNVQHGIIPHQSMRHAGPGGGPIPIAALSSLDDEELAWLERITAKLAAIGGNQG